LTTINDVANKAKVSKTTISRYLNGKYEYMSESTKIRIEKAIEDLNYRPNLVASSLKKNRTKTIGIIISNIENPFFAAFVQKAEQILHKMDNNVILCNTGDDPKIERKDIDTLLGRQVDGILLTTSGGNNDLINNDLIKKDFPLVLVDRRVSGLKADLVALDNEQATYLAMEHLYQNGHRRIGLLTGYSAGISSRIERINAYKKFLIEHEIDTDQSLVWSGVPNQNGGKEGVNKLLSLQNPPTALLSTLNILTLGIIEFLNQKNIKIPNDVSIVTFDDVYWVKVVSPPLTAIKQPIEELAKASINCIFERMNKNNKPFKEILLPGTLIKRSSTRSI